MLPRFRFGTIKTLWPYQVPDFSPAVQVDKNPGARRDCIEATPEIGFPSCSLSQKR